MLGLTFKDIEHRNVNIDHQLQRMSDIRCIIENTNVDSGARVLPIAEDVAQALQAIVKDKNVMKWKIP